MDDNRLVVLPMSLVTSLKTHKKLKHQCYALMTCKLVVDPYPHIILQEFEQPSRLSARKPQAHRNASNQLKKRTRHKLATPNTTPKPVE